jgi:hypothetical protein
MYDSFNTQCASNTVKIMSILRMDARISTYVPIYHSPEADLVSAAAFATVHHEV